VAETVPHNLLADFLSIAEPNALSAEAHTLLEAVARAQERSGILTSLQDIQQRLRPRIRGEEAPWEQGYRFARELRAELGLNGQAIRGLDGLAKALGSSVELLEAATTVESLPLRGVDAVIGTEGGASPGFVVSVRGQRSARFAFCRGLFEYLATPRARASLITRTYSDRQKRNRAFAAEFLLPAATLKSRIKTDRVTDEEIDEFAAEFDISPMIVSHQIVNHRIASVAVQ
jgi:hypothetical protein